MLTNPYGSFGTGVLDANLLAAAGGFEAFLLFCAFVATIVLTVLAYKKYVSKAQQPSFKLKDKESWGPFVRFENLVIEKVLIALYLFMAIGLALTCAAVILGGLVGAFIRTGSGYAALGWGEFFMLLIAQVIIFFIGELLLRLGFELQMLLVIIAHNTSDLKKKLVGTAAPFASTPTDTVAAPAAAPVEAPATPAPTAAVATPVAAPAPAQTAPVAEPAPEPQPTAPAAPAEAPTAPAEPATDQAAPTQPVCPACLTPYEPGSKYCGKCGHALT